MRAGLFGGAHSRAELTDQTTAMREYQLGGGSVPNRRQAGRFEVGFDLDL